MDGITEPVLLILGHPIAGNPSQFALERAFESIRASWRVLSCDVAPERIDDAIAGAEVLGFRGLLLDHNVVTSHSSAGDQVDFLMRGANPDAAWQPENLFSAWLESEVRRHFDGRDGEIGPLLWIGTPDANFPSEWASEHTRSPIGWASEEAIEHADVIAVSESVDVAQWPATDSKTLVVDFTRGTNDTERMREIGYDVLGEQEARIGVLMLCLQRLTGKQPAVEVLTEAIEEYLAV